MVIRRINLLPPELAARRRTRRQTGLLAAGGGVLLVLLAIIYLIFNAQLSAERQKVADQQARNAQIRRQVDALQRFEGKQMELQNKQATLSALSRNEVLWSSVLQDLSIAVPSDSWLTSLTGAVTPPATTTGATPGTGSLGPQNIGQVLVSGCTLIPPEGEYLNVAEFLVQIAKPTSFGEDVFLTRAEKAKAPANGPAPTCPVSFNSQIFLKTHALRVQQGKERRV
ncbi:MAG: hypothetical protein NVSMB57_16850 [Actinomycetota bacterium]